MFLDHFLSFQGTKNKHKIKQNGVLIPTVLYWIHKTEKLTDDIVWHHKSYNLTLGLLTLCKESMKC